jgi:hypothetical protein
LLALCWGLGLEFYTFDTVVAEVCAGDHKMQSVTRTLGSDLERTVLIAATSVKKEREAETDQTERKAETRAHR